MGKHQNRNVDPQSADYDAGYCKPPKHGQFQPGHTRNKGGKRKPKEPTLSEIGDEIVEVPQKDGSVKRMSNRQFISRTVVALARKGSVPHLRIWMENERRVEAGEDDLNPLIFDPELSEAVLQTNQADLKARIAADNWADNHNDTKPKEKKNG